MNGWEVRADRHDICPVFRRTLNRRSAVGMWRAVAGCREELRSSMPRVPRCMTGRSSGPLPARSPAVSRAS